MGSQNPRIIGDFKIKRELGRGGMGVVYLARQLSLARDVALKVLSREASEDVDRILRFQREAALLGRLAHPHIVRVFLVGEDQDRHFLAMEYIEGSDLEKSLRTSLSGDTKSLPRDFGEDFISASVRAARDTALALGAAHDQGIVHRDVKPSNILISNDGRVLLADFGLARELTAQALTESGTLMGTPFYMSPERFRAQEPDPKSDVYALGAVLYECVTGVRVFEAESAELLMARILEEEPMPPRLHEPGISRDLETVILKCIEKDPDLRYPDGNVLAEELTRVLNGEPVEAVPAGTLTRWYRRARRRRVSALVLILLGLVAAGFLAFGAWKAIGKHRQESEHRYETALAGVATALNSDDLDQAHRLMDEELAAFPDHSAVRFERADLFLRIKEWAFAADDFDWLARDSVDPVAASLGRELAHSILQRRQAAPELNDPPATGRQAFYLGLIRYSQRDHGAAALLFQQAVVLDEGLVEARYSLATIYQRMNRLEEAELVYREYDRRRSRSDTFMQLGRMDMDRKRYESAVAAFERYVKMKPENVVGWNNLAGAHVGQAMKFADLNLDSEFRDEVSRARSAIDRARDLDDAYFLVSFQDAVVHTLEGKVGEAEQLFVRAVMQLNERAATSVIKEPEWVRKMWIHFPAVLATTGQAQKGIEYLELAREQFPEFGRDPDWIYQYAECLWMAGRSGDALKVLDEASAGEHAGNKRLFGLREKIGGGR